jgi:hypothetical protein
MASLRLEIGFDYGVEELSKDKLNPLLRLKYHDSITDAIADLGRPEEIGRVFAGFQRYLYEKATGRPRAHGTG